ncbi:MAG: DegV family protein [Coriobacteriaceae bacterium]|nr:DegV family protein [Coriobacteriaceae bacterium]
MTWALVTDSSCNMRSYQPRTTDCIFDVAPLKIEVADTEYVDDATLNVSELNRLVADEPSASGSACPSVGEWSDIFSKADNVIAVTISSQLSGSYDAACMARNLVMDEHMREHNGVISGKNIYVLDSKAAGGKLELIIELLDRYLSTHPNASFDEVVHVANLLESKSQVQYSLSSYDNLTKNGRMPKLVGKLASGLNIRVLGTASPQGTIKIVGPTRGDKKTYRKIIDVMKADGYRGGLVYIDHVSNESGAGALKDAIAAEWPTATIKILPCGGLCSYYAEATGLIIGYEWCGLL